MSITADDLDIHSRVLNGDLLSRREREVLGHIAEGRTDREISCLLKRSHKTVARHAENILLKLRARNRSHAVAKALTYRIIGLSSEQ
ncbi:MAG: response regulator transcription factor [Methyloceanibacter sp.]